MHRSNGSPLLAEMHSAFHHILLPKLIILEIFPPVLFVDCFMYLISKATFMAAPMASDLVLAIIFQMLSVQKGRLVGQKKVSSWKGSVHVSRWGFFILEVYESEASNNRDEGLLLHTQACLCLPCAVEDLPEHWNPLLP